MSLTQDGLAAGRDRTGLIEESILPTQANQRPIGMLGYAWIWVGIAVIIATYSLGATGIQGGFSLGAVVLTILLANLAIGALMLLTADIGAEHGLSFAVYLRAPFGLYGTHLPAVSRGIVAAMWFGIQTYLGALALILVVLAQWSTNNSANLIPAALTFVNLAPRFVTYRSGVALAGIVGTLCFPWQILDNLFVFLGYYGAFLSAIGGIIIADYYVIRNRRVNVPALYDPEGQYRYHRGFNPAGMIAWLLAGAIAAWWSSYAFVIGFPLGFLLYLVLMKVLVLPRYGQAEMEPRGPEDYLAASVGMDWVHLGGGRFARMPCGSGNAGDREDL